MSLREGQPPGGRRPRHAVFVGREAELGLLAEAFVEAREGQPRLVLIEGIAGIGKSSLIERFLEDLIGVRVMRASGDESERDLDYAVIDQLHRSAGEVEVGVETASRFDAVGTNLLHLLGRLQDDGPVVLFIDDVQWCDRASMSALLFALRRLVADSVLAVMVARSDQGPEGLWRLAATKIGRRLRLGGLEPDQLRELAARCGLADLSRAGAQRLHEHTLGSPLHARALLEQISPADWFAEVLPAPREVAAGVISCLAACSEPARALVTAAAILTQPARLDTITALAGVADGLGALEEAVAVGLLSHSEHDGSVAVSFPTPLVRAAVHQVTGVGWRHALHRAAAQLVTDEAESLRHRVAAAPGVDADLAEALEKYAVDAAQRGAVSIASSAFVQASRKSVTAEDAARRLLAGVEWMLQGGDLSQAVSYREEIGKLPAGSGRDRVLARIVHRRQPKRAEAFARSAWRLSQEVRDERAAAQAARLRAQLAIVQLRGAEAALWSRRALALAPQDDPIVSWSRAELALGLALSGRVSEGLAELDLALDLDDPHDAYDGTPLRGGRGWLMLMDDRILEAHRELTSTADAALAAGNADVAAVNRALLSRAEYLLGAWDAAVVHGEQALAMIRSIEGSRVDMFAPWAAVYVPAARGDFPAAAEILGLFDRTCELADHVAARSLATAHVASVEGNPRGVLDALEPLRSLVVGREIEISAVWPWQALYAEALLDAHDADAAGALLDVFEPAAAMHRRRSTIGELARVRGRLHSLSGRTDEAVESFEAGLRALSQLPLPFEKARLQLDYGRTLRRGGLRQAATERLSRALRSFVELRALPYIEAAESELAASGLHPRSRKAPGGDQLTSREQSVAELVAQGLANREIADRLSVSVRTVEVHLTRIYRKVGVHSRAQLAAGWTALAEDAAAAPS